MERFMTKLGSVASNVIRDRLPSLLSNLRRECIVVTVERFHSCALEDAEF